jgi:Holliday junction DNA helicase RuvA
MIGLLRGRLLMKQPPQLLLDVQGVGYEIDAPMTTFYQLPDVGAEVTLHIHMAVREDAHTLYGFMQSTDRDLFRSLLKVNGVGARLALTILSGMEPARFVQCVQQEDTDALVRLPGIGKKTAERLIIELRDRLAKSPGLHDAPSVGPATALPINPVEDAVSALVGLGYKPQEASRMVRSINADDLSSEEIIRQALQAVVQ